MKKTVFLLFTMLCALTACAESLSVVCTDFPCYDLARAILGNDAEVQMLLKPGMEAHTYDPSPTDILSIAGADLFVMIGGESDAWADSVLGSMGADTPKTLRLIDCVETLDELEADEPGEAPALDEHIWTSPKNTLIMLDAVEEALVNIAPEREAELHRNAADHRAEIEDIDKRLTEIVASGKRRTLVFADRFPFQYLTNDYGLDYKAAFLSCTAQTEPSAKVIVELIDVIVTEDIPVVYTIELSNGAIAETLRQETGVPSTELHSMQTVTLSEFESGETYVSIMDKNLEAIERGLS